MPEKWVQDLEEILKKEGWEQELKNA